MTPTLTDVKRKTGQVSKAAAATCGMTGNMQTINGGSSGIKFAL